MPIPRPRDDESQSDFMTRCMGNSIMKSEFPKNKQRVAVCMSAWRDKGKKKHAEVDKEQEETESERIIRAFIKKYPKLKRYIEDTI